MNESSSLIGCSQEQRHSHGLVPKSRISIQNIVRNGVLPHSIEAEQSVLGCLLEAPSRSMEVLQAEGITEAYFYDLRHAELFQRIIIMLKEGKHVDLITLNVELHKDGFLERLGGIRYLTALIEKIPAAANLPYYLPELKDAYQRRAALETASNIVSKAQDATIDADSLLVDVEQAVNRLRKAAQPAALSLFKPVEIHEREFDPHDNILADRLLAKGQSLTLLGPGGIGKSRLLLQMAASCILGRPFCGLRTYNSDLKWLIIQAENSTRRLQSDIAALFRWAGREAGKINEQMLLHTIDGEADTWLNLDNSGVRQKLATMIAQSGADVICFDPLNAFAGGDLNSDHEMRRTCAWINALARHENPSRAVVVVHHSLTGKAGVAKATGFDRNSFGRNSKLLQAWTRGQINIAPASAEDNTRMIISCGKCSNGEEFPAYALRLNPDTMIYEEDGNFDLASWEQQFDERKSKDDWMQELFMELCPQPMGQPELVAAMQAQRGLSRASAYRQIKRALSLGWLKEAPGDKVVRTTIGDTSAKVELDITEVE